MSEKKTVKDPRMKDSDYLVSNPIPGKKYTTSWADEPGMSWTFLGYNAAGLAITETSKGLGATKPHYLRELEETALINMHKRIAKEEKGLIPKIETIVLEPSLPETVSTEPQVTKTEPKPRSAWTDEEESIISSTFTTGMSLAKLYELTRPLIGLHRTDAALTIKISDMTICERYIEIITERRAKLGLETFVYSQQDLDDYVAYKTVKEDTTDDEVCLNDLPLEYLTEVEYHKSVEPIAVQEYISPEEVLRNYEKSLYTNSKNQIETPERERLVVGGVIDIPYAGLLKSDFVIRGLFVLERQELEKPKE